MVSASFLAGGERCVLVKIKKEGNLLRWNLLGKKEKIIIRKALQEFDLKHEQFRVIEYCKN